MRCIAVLALVACGTKSTGHLETIEAPSIPTIAPLIAAERESAISEGKQLVVYAGADWCSPCRRFHDAVASGKLDAPFGKLRLIMFDSDRDMAALKRAGYTYTAIPLFAIPGPDGRASGQQIENGPNGDDAVADITARLNGLLGTR